MESTKAPELPSREELAAALKDRDVPELQEMGKRLAKSCKDLELLLEDLKVEQQSLQDENRQLTETIELMMRELRKLNIGADNTVEPVLVSETPIDITGAMGRLWEKVRPRDNAVVVSEHVGELKKPGDEAGPKVVDRLSDSFSAWGNSLGPLWQTAQQNLQTTGEALWSSAQEGAAGASAQAKSLRSRWLGESGGEEPSKDSKAEVIKKTGAALPHAAPPPAAAPAPAAAAGPVAVPAPAPTPTVDAGQTPPAASVAEDCGESAVLIEATITLEDGSMQKLCIRAADRCKEVSARFCKEHSLEDRYLDPLTKWLKKVESDTEEFPGKAEAELVEIYQTFSPQSS